MYFTILMINYIHHKLYRGNLLRFSMLRLTRKTTSNVDYFLKNYSSFFIFLLLFSATSTASSTREIFFIFSIIILQNFYWLQWSVYCMEFVFFVVRVDYFVCIFYCGFFGCDGRLKMFALSGGVSCMRFGSVPWLFDTILFSVFLVLCFCVV